MKNYSIIQKFLHDIFLSNNFLKKSIYEIEKILFNRKKIDFENNKHVFISGLPRSGTTALLNYLFHSKAFSSLTYRNMPFVMAPNISSILMKNTKLVSRERIHKDGIFFDLDTPESFDEVFFSTFERNEIKKEFLNYLNLILIQKNSKRYLSKNNLSYRYIDLIQSLLNKSIFLIPFRDPEQHANSLLKQHINFCKMQKENQFIRRYMKYLGHFEFGLDHKSWNSPTKFANFNDINYWLEQWIKFYRHLLEKNFNKKNILFICYEKLNNPNFKRNICNFLDINTENTEKYIIKKSQLIANPDNELLVESKKLYNELTDQCFQ